MVVDFIINWYRLRPILPATSDLPVVGGYVRLKRTELIKAGP
jgi:hypothetical protein